MTRTFQLLAKYDLASLPCPPDVKEMEFHSFCVLITRFAKHKWPFLFPLIY